MKEWRFLTLLAVGGTFIKSQKSRRALVINTDHSLQTSASDPKFDGGSARIELRGNYELEDTRKRRNEFAYIPISSVSADQVKLIAHLLT